MDDLPIFQLNINELSDGIRSSSAAGGAGCLVRKHIKEAAEKMVTLHPPLL